MSKHRKLAAAVAFTSLFFVAGSASAYNEPCGTEFQAVDTAINAAAFPGKRGETDRTNLLAKLAAADGKFKVGKYGDSIGKLEDISSAASAKAKDATYINLAVTDAIGCVGDYASQ